MYLGFILVISPFDYAEFRAYEGCTICFRRSVPLTEPIYHIGHVTNVFNVITVRVYYHY